MSVSTTPGARPARRLAALQLVGIEQLFRLVVPCQTPRGTHPEGRPTTVSRLSTGEKYSAIWYVIFSNSHTASNTSLEAEVRFIDQLSVEQTQVSVITQNLISTPLVLGFIAAGLGLSILGIWWVRRREPTPAVRYDEILPKPS